VWREAKDSDDVASMMMGLYEEDPSTVPMTHDKIAMTLQTLRAQPARGVVVVWEQGDVAVGYALLCSFWSNELGGDVCVLDELYVRRAFRNQGAVTSLVDGLAQHALPWFRDSVALELEVTPGNDRARALYERLGFSPFKNTRMRRVRLFKPY
jgi:ribosomal protein S18 acetylase RimI-like enzyme